MGAPVLRWQMVSPDPDAAAGFYQKLFGWSTTRDNAIGYREVDTGSTLGIQGGIWPAPPGAPGMVQLCVEVADVAACIAQAEPLGASVIVPRSVLPDGDTMAILGDPAGVSVLIYTPARKD